MFLVTSWRRRITVLQWLKTSKASSLLVWFLLNLPFFGMRKGAKEPVKETPVKEAIQFKILIFSFVPQTELISIIKTYLFSFIVRPNPSPACSKWSSFHCFVSNNRGDLVFVCFLFSSFSSTKAMNQWINHIKSKCTLSSIQYSVKPNRRTEQHQRTVMFWFHVVRDHNIVIFNSHSTPIQFPFNSIVPYYVLLTTLFHDDKVTINSHRLYYAHIEHKQKLYKCHSVACYAGVESSDNLENNNKKTLK